MKNVGSGSGAELATNVVEKGKPLMITSPFVIHNYRWRLSLAKGERRYDELEQKLLKRPVITVPAITIRQ